MANAARKWIAPALIAAATVASAAAYGELPPLVEMRLEPVLPFEVSEPSQPMRREFALFLIPAVTLVIWAAFRLAPTGAGERIGRRLLRNAPAAVTSPEQFERFGKTYETIVLGVVMLLLGGHAAVLLALLGRPGMASRIIPVVLGASLILMGNVMPRLRPNWVAGLRTRRLLEDPQLWRAAHRAFGAAFVVAGLLTIAVGIALPRFGVMTGVASLLAALVVGFIAGRRSSASVGGAAV